MHPPKWRRYSRYLPNWQNRPLYTLTHCLLICCRASLCGGKDQSRLAMPLDLDKYRPYVDGFDLSEAQKDELIHTLWSIMEAFADQAFGLHPAQQIPAALSADDSPAQADGVDLNAISVAGPFEQAAGPSRQQEDAKHENG